MKTEIKIIIIHLLLAVALIGGLRIYTMWSTDWKCDTVVVCSCETLEASGYKVSRCEESK